MSTPKRIGVIIPAGGSGQRLGSVIPKQFLLLNGAPIIVHSITTILQIPNLEAVVIAAHPDSHNLLLAMLSEHGCNSPCIHLVEGGDERQASVANALIHASLLNVDIIGVHDAVRPFASFDLWNRVIQGAITHGAAVPGLPVSDTIKGVNDSGFVESTPDRSTLQRVQTPQCFRRASLIHAHGASMQLEGAATDCASLCERIGIPVFVVSGEERNIKITTPFDMDVANLFLTRN